MEEPRNYIELINFVLCVCGDMHIQVVINFGTRSLPVMFKMEPGMDIQRNDNKVYRFDRRWNGVSDRGGFLIIYIDKGLMPQYVIMLDKLLKDKFNISNLEIAINFDLSVPTEIKEMIDAGITVKHSSYSHGR